MVTRRQGTQCRGRWHGSKAGTAAQIHGTATQIYGIYGIYGASLVEMRLQPDQACLHFTDKNVISPPYYYTLV